MAGFKIALSSAAGAALLAFISGLFGMVTFGALLLRSLFWSGLFGLFSFGVYVLLQKTVPEVFEKESELENEFENEENAGEEASSTTGNKLNIVLEGDEPSYDSFGPEGDGEEMKEGDLEEENEFIEEIRAVDEEGENEEGVDEVEERVSTVTSSSADRTQVFDEVVKEGGALSDLDTLPDLEDFSDSFESVAASQETSDHFSTKGREEVTLPGGQHDPATVAKAVRTIIGRDQEG